MSSRSAAKTAHRSPLSPTSRGSAGDSRGFTLIEVLVAVGLTAALSAALYSTFFSISGASRSAGKTIDSYIEAGYFLERFSREARASYYRRGSELTFFNGGRDGEAGAVSFTTMTWPVRTSGAPSGDLAAVNYYVREEGGRKDLVKEVWNPFQTEKFTVEAVEDIKGFEVSFFNGRDWAGAWDASLEGQTPTAVSVTVTLGSGERLSATARTMIR